MVANMPSAENCGYNENSKEYNDRSIPRDSLEHACLQQKKIPDEFDYDFCSPAEQLDLLNILRSVQVHSHRDTCYKKSVHCRFNYPWPLRSKTEIAYVKLKGMKEWQLRVLAERNHHMVNNYNAWTVVNFRGNTDIQFICNPHGTATYCCLYSSKAEAPDKSIISTKVLKALASKESLDVHAQTRKMIYLAAMAVYSSREVSAQEATWSLLGYPFHFSSKTVIDVNLLPAQKFQRKLKSASALSAHELDSTDILASSENLTKDFQTTCQ